MRLFDNLRLAVKLPIVLGTLALLSLLAMGYTSHRTARDALIDAGEARILTMINAKLLEYNAWFETVSSDLKSQAASPMTVRAINDFSQAWARLGPDAQTVLQKQYITDDPNPKGHRYNLRQSGEVSDYALAHARYHAGFVSVFREKGYHDVMLIDSSGNILYSVAKESDFGQNLFVGPLRGTNLAKVARRVIQSRNPAVLFSDFETYMASGGVAASFAAAPILSANGRVLGALVFQISVTQVDAILDRHHGSDLQVRSYLVGRDHRLRSNAAVSPTPTALVMHSDTEAIKRAFSVEHSVTRELGLSGVPSILMTGQIEVPGYDLALIIEQSEAELTLPIARLTRNMLIDGTVSMAVLSLLAFLLGRNLSRPLEETAERMRLIAAGDYVQRGVSTPRRDEVGTISRALEAVRDGLAAGAAATRDGAFKSAAFEGSSAALLIMDRRYRISYVNPTFARMFRSHRAEFGMTAPEVDPAAIIGRPFTGFHKDFDAVCDRINAPGGVPCQIEIHAGDARFALNFNEVRTETEGRIGYVVEWREVTVERMNRAVLTAIDGNLATAEFDAAGVLIKANANMYALLGVTEADIVGRSHADIVRYDRSLVARCDTVWDRMLAGESVFDRFWMCIGDRPESVIDGGLSPVRDDDGQLLKVLLMGSDVTAAQQGLRDAEDQRHQMQSAQAQVVDALRVGLRGLSDGDLTIRIDAGFALEYETLRGDFNMSVERLAEAMSTVISSSGAIDAVVQDIAHASDDLSRRTERQAATMEQTAAALDQLTVSVQSAANGAAEASVAVAGARASADASGAIMRDAVTAMGEIERSSEKIARIIGVIDDIAFQTNLLALNAGVEAARAGDAGRGFAVVATEVRALAQRSSDAAREIDLLISDASLQVKRGVGLVGQSGQALQGIVGLVSQVAARMSDIAMSAQEQSTSLAEINLAVNQIDHVTQQNTALFGETAAAGQLLKTGAEALASTVARFRVDVEPGVGRTAADARAPAAAGSADGWSVDEKPPEPAYLRPRPDPGHRFAGAATRANAARVRGSAVAQAAVLPDPDAEDWDEF